MITISFEKRGSTGLCEYLFQNIKKQIQEGILLAGEKLPSKRSLSANLGISVITVQNAYARLIDEGYVYSLEKKGFFISDYLPLAEKKQSLEKEKDISEEKKYFADFKSNAVSFEKFPFRQWSHVMREVLQSGNEKLLSKTDAFGVYELRKAIANYLREFRGMNVNTSQIVVGAGTENLYWILIELLGKERVYGVENPGYKKISDIVKLNGAVCKNIKIDEQGMEITSLEKNKCEIAHASPSHHFPTGRVMTFKRRQELLEWAKKTKNLTLQKKRFIIEDDFDSEFRFSGKPLPTLQSADSTGSVIYVNTFSKTLSPSFRIGFLVLPENLIPQFTKKFTSYSCPVSSFEQYALARFIDEGYYGSHIIRMKNYYRTLRNDLLLALKKSSILKSCVLEEKEAGLHFLLINKSQNKKINFPKIQKVLAEELNINLPLLSDFYSGKINEAEKNVFVLNYSGIKKEKIPLIVKKMENAFSLEE